MEDQHQASSRPPSKTTLNELLDTLKLLEEEPQRLPKSYHKEKYAWINEVGVKVHAVKPRSLHHQTENQKCLSGHAQRMPTPTLSPLTTWSATAR